MHLMRLIYSLAFMISVLSCSLPGPRSSGSNPKPDGPASSYTYTYNATMYYPLEYYDVKRDSTGAVRIAWLKDQGPDVVAIAGPEDFFDRLDALVAEYKLHLLKESYWPRMHILDGNSWRLKIRFVRNSIYATGENAWPRDKQRSGINAINDYIRSLIAASGEEDIILRMEYMKYTQEDL